MTDVPFQSPGYANLTPQIIVADASAAIAFYSEVFGAVERMRMEDAEQGIIWHSELQIGDSLVMLSDEFPDMNIVSPKTLGGTGGGLNVYVEDCDATYAKALATGATALRPPEDQFWGDRSGQFLDPFGHRWSVATHVEDVSPEEIQRRAGEMLGS